MFVCASLDANQVICDHLLMRLTSRQYKLKTSLYFSQKNLKIIKIISYKLKSENFGSFIPLNQTIETFFYQNVRSLQKELQIQTKIFFEKPLSKSVKR